MKVFYCALLIIVLSFTGSLVAQDLDSLKAELASANNEVRPEILLQIIRKHYHHGSYEEGRKLIDKSLKEFEATDNRIYQALTYRWLCIYHTIGNQYDSAGIAIRKAERFLHLLSPLFKGDLYQAKAFLLRHTSAEQLSQILSDSCIKAHKMAYHQFEMAGDTSGMLVNMFSHALHHRNFQRNDEAILLAQKHYKIAHITNNKLEIHNSIYLLAKIQSSMREYGESLKNAYLALESARKLNFNIADCYFLILDVYDNMGDKSSGISMLDSIQANGDYENLSLEDKVAFWSLYANFSWDDSEKALVYLKKQRELYLEHNVPREAARINARIGIHLIEKKNYKQAIKNIEAYLPFIDKEYISRLTYYQQIIAYAYVADKSYPKAVTEFEKYIGYSQQNSAHMDSLYQARLQKNTSELFVKFETEKKEEEIKLLQEKQRVKEVQLKQSRTLLTALLIGLVLLITTTWVFFNGRKKLAAANDEISKQNLAVQTRNLEINQQNEELQQKNQELTQLHAEKDNLMQIVAHDLKAPLDNIASLSYLSMQTQAPKEEIMSYHQLVKKEHNRGKSLIQDLLKVHGVEKGLIKPNYTEVSVTHLIAEVINANDNCAVTKSMKIFFNRTGLSLITTDQKWLSQVISNLLSNAIKYSPAGSSIRIDVTDKPKNIFISIQDEGPGFSEEDQMKVFRKFQRLSAQPTGGEGSTGLGLSIVKSYVEKLGGKISLESRPGQGSKFLMIFPKEPQSLSQNKTDKRHF